MRFNPTVSVYWLWLAVIAGVLAVVPVVPYFDTMGGKGRLHIAFLYGADFCDYSDPYTEMGDDKWILLHAAASALLAVAVTAIYRAGPQRSRPDYQPDPKTFTLASLLLVVTAVACVFSLLACLGAIYALYLVVLIFVAGRFAVVLLDALGL